MKAEFKVEVTRRVKYNSEPRQIDETMACADINDLIRELNERGGIILAKGEAERGANQYGGYLVTWGRVADDEELFGCRCGCRRVVKRDGSFRPGHDAKLVGSLLYLVRERWMNRDEAMNKLADRPNLQAKLARLLDK